MCLACPGEIVMRQNKFRGNIFVANLPNGFTDEELAQLFDPYGIVLGAFMAREAGGKGTKGCGLVNVAPPRAAEAAIAALDGLSVRGRKIEVRSSAPGMAITIPKPPRAPRTQPAPHATGDEGHEAVPYAAARRPAQRPVVVEYRNRFRSLAPGFDRR
ncbi:MAG: RNA-binding protein [Alphaproteobacteria bacterium]|nr:RNA-binding protein [Alphaproteobacteria bacterium]